MKKPPSAARLAYLKMRREKAAARLVKCEVKDFTFADWHKVVAEFDSRCAYCMRKMRRLTRDHVVPLFKGGNHTISNIVPACRSCNSSKGTNTLEEWFNVR